MHLKKHTITFYSLGFKRSLKHAHNLGEQLDGFPVIFDNKEDEKYSWDPLPYKHLKELMQPTSNPKE